MKLKDVHLNQIYYHLESMLKAYLKLEIKNGFKKLILKSKKENSKKKLQKLISVLFNQTNIKEKVKNLISKKLLKLVKIKEHF